MNENMETDSDSSGLIDWLDQNHFILDGVRYQTLGDPEEPLDMKQLIRMSTLRSTSSELLLAKTRGNIDRCLEVYGDLHPENILELGILQGGSVSFLSSLCQPKKFVALELNPEPRHVLEEHLASRGLTDSVKVFYGVDQSDRKRVPELIEQEFEGPLDLVIDDASHLLAETRTSFNMLFPRLRPGGLYVIEDWSWAHTAAPGFLEDHSPLTQLVFELVVASANANNAITEVIVDRELTVVRRGTQVLDPDQFDISDLLDDRTRAMLPLSLAQGS